MRPRPRRVVRPRGYDDALRLFSGDLARPDGTHAARVSHANATNVGVLAWLGVRYLILHRGRYAAADWPGVLAQLAATGRADPAGDFGATVLILWVVPWPYAAVPASGTPWAATSASTCAAGSGRAKW